MSINSIEQLWQVWGISVLVDELFELIGEDQAIGVVVWVGKIPLAVANILYDIILQLRRSKWAQHNASNNLKQVFRIIIEIGNESNKQVADMGIKLKKQGIDQEYNINDAFLIKSQTSQPFNDPDSLLITLFLQKLEIDTFIQYFLELDDS